MNEFELIDRFFKGAASERHDVLLGIGDDAAVVSVPAGCRLIIATDSLVEGTHFPENTPPHALGYRCLAINLSDLAAMGAEPLWVSLALSLPEADGDWLQAFANGFFELANQFEIALVGGDTVRGPLSVTVTAHGKVEDERFVGRNGAAVGDRIYLTGTVGDAAAGLRLLTDPEQGEPAGNDQLLQRFLYPSPRVSQGRQLAGIATAMIDISDGLHDDLSKLLSASHLGADLEIADLPLSPALRQFAEHDAAVRLGLSGGEDYELCFTVPADAEDELQRLALTWECRLTCIGRTHEIQGLRWRLDGKSFNEIDEAFQHF